MVDPADPQKFIKQTINASIVYDTEFVESAVWFNDEYTYLVGEESEWIVISTDVTLDNISTKGKYRVVDGGILTVLNTAISSRFQVKGDGQLIFAGTNNRILTGLIEVKSEDGSLIFSGNNTFNNVITNLGTVTIAKDSKVTLNQGLVNSGTVLAYASVNGMVENAGTYKVMADGLKLNTTNFDNTNGNLVVNASLVLNWDVKGTVSVTAAGHLAVNGVTEVTADIVNNGVIEFSNEYNTLALSGDIEKGNGTFKSATPATMVFSGNVATGTAAVFDNISNVVYDSLASEGQNIILGTYNNLQIEGSLKTVDDGTVTVAGNFVNNLNPGDGVMITDDGELILKGEVSGTGAFTNAGTLTFAESAEGTAASIVNGGTVNLNADDFTVADGENKGTYNINGKNAALTMTNGKAGKVVINGTNAALSGMNLGNVTVNGSAVTTMEDKAGASYDVTGKGTLSLGDNGNGGVYNATINNAGKVTVDTDITDFAGGVANNGTIQVNGGMSSNAVNDLFAGNGSGLLQLNNNGIDLQNTTVNGNVEVNYALEGDDLKGVTVAENALLEINKSSGTLTSVIANNKGTVQIDKKAEVTFDMAEAGFNGVYNVDGSLTVNGNAEFDGSVNNSGTISVNGAAAFNADVDNSGSINAFETDFNAAINNSGSVAAVYADFNGAVNNTGSINAADSNFNGAVNNTGSITTEYVDFNAAVNNSGSIKADDADFNGPLNNSNTITVETEGNFAGSVNNSGNIASGAEGVLTFSGATQGNGTVKGNAVYNDKAVAVFGGNYSELTVNNAAQLSTSAQVDTMNLNGSLATAENAVLTLNGETKGKGIMAGGKGTVVYNGFSAEQTIYAGAYNNLSLGKSAIGVFNTAGDITISGNAYDLSVYAELGITGNKVTYNGTGTQHVMGGTYDELVMAGSGTKLMEADTFKVNSFVSNGGSSSNMLRLVSASAPEQWFLDANSISINYSYIDNAKTTGKIFLDGTNMTGGGNSDNWLVFNSAGGVGDSYPSINNPNFQAISLHLLALDEFWNGTGRFDAFRRMPVATQAIAVGDMSAPMVLDAAAGYDMIDFDGEFFGSADSIGILDEEASDVLNDAASADNGDLKALLEK